MNRYRHARADAPHRLSGPFGIEMANPKPRPPSPHRQQRNVDLAGEIGHFRKQIGVAREIDARGLARYEEAQRRAQRGKRMAPHLMPGGESGDPNRTD